MNSKSSVLTSSAIAVLLGSALLSSAPARAEFRISFGNKSQIVGSGKVVNVNRAVGAFDRVEVRDGISVTLRKASESKLLVSADDNIEPLVEAKTEGSTLVLRMRPNTSLRTKTPIAVNLSYVRLDALALSDGVSADIDTIASAQFALTVSDGANLRGVGVVANKINVSVTDGANVKLASMRASEAQSYRVADGARMTVDTTSGAAISVKVSDGAKAVLREIDTKALDIVVSDGASAELAGSAQQQSFALSDAASINARELKGESARAKLADGSALKAGALSRFDVEVDEVSSVRYAGEPALTVRSREKLNVKRY